MAKIVSFGDSFVYGSEIEGNTHGELAWPALVARRLGVSYLTLSNPGCGNDAIAQQIYQYFSTNPVENTLAVINWTWTMRWDFYIAAHETWITLGPTCVPQKLQHLVDTTESHRLVDFYRDYANRSLLWNKFRNLQTIFAAQQFLRLKRVRAIQTYMDHELFSTEWHAPHYVQALQALVKPNMQDWEVGNFLDWSRHGGHAVTEPGLHPLASAHVAAADYWLERYARALAPETVPDEMKSDYQSVSINIDQDQSKLITVTPGRVSFYQWGMSLPDDEREKFIQLHESHEKFVRDAELAGDVTITTNKQGQIELRWRDEPTHGRWLATVPDSDHRQYLALWDSYRSTFDQDS